MAFDDGERSPSKSPSISSLLIAPNNNKRRRRKALASSESDDGEDIKPINKRARAITPATSSDIKREIPATLTPSPTFDWRTLDYANINSMSSVNQKFALDYFQHRWGGYSYEDSVKMATSNPIDAGKVVLPYQYIVDVYIKYKIAEATKKLQEEMREWIFYYGRGIEEAALKRIGIIQQREMKALQDLFPGYYDPNMPDRRVITDPDYKLLQTLYFNLAEAEILRPYATRAIIGPYDVNRTVHSDPYEYILKYIYGEYWDKIVLREGFWITQYRGEPYSWMVSFDDEGNAIQHMSVGDIMHVTRLTVEQFNRISDEEKLRWGPPPSTSKSIVQAGIGKLSRATDWRTLNYRGIHEGKIKLSSDDIRRADEYFQFRRGGYSYDDSVNAALKFSADTYKYTKGIKRYSMFKFGGSGTLGTRWKSLINTARSMLKRDTRDQANIRRRELTRQVDELVSITSTEMSRGFPAFEPPILSIYNFAAIAYVYGDIDNYQRLVELRDHAFDIIAQDEGFHIPLSATDAHLPRLSMIQFHSISKTERASWREGSISSDNDDDDTINESKEPSSPVAATSPAAPVATAASSSTPPRRIGAAASLDDDDDIGGKRGAGEMNDGNDDDDDSKREAKRARGSGEPASPGDSKSELKSSSSLPYTMRSYNGAWKSSAPSPTPHIPITIQYYRDEIDDRTDAEWDRDVPPYINTINESDPRWTRFIPKVRLQHPILEINGYGESVGPYREIAKGELQADKNQNLLRMGYYWHLRDRGYPRPIAIWIVDTIPDITSRWRVNWNTGILGHFEPVMTYKDNLAQLKDNYDRYIEAPLNRAKRDYTARLKNQYTGMDPGAIANAELAAIRARIVADPPHMIGARSEASAWAQYAASRAPYGSPAQIELSELAERYTVIHSLGGWNIKGEYMPLLPEQEGIEDALHILWDIPESQELKEARIIFEEFNNDASKPITITEREAKARLDKLLEQHNKQEPTSIRLARDAWQKAEMIALNILESKSSPSSSAAATSPGAPPSVSTAAPRRRVGDFNDDDVGGKRTGGGHRDSDNDDDNNDKESKRETKRARGDGTALAPAAPGDSKAPVVNTIIDINRTKMKDEGYPTYLIDKYASSIPDTYLVEPYDGWKAYGEEKLKWEFFSKGGQGLGLRNKAKGLKVSQFRNSMTQDYKNDVAAHVTMEDMMNKLAFYHGVGVAYASEDGENLSKIAEGYYMTYRGGRTWTPPDFERFVSELDDDDDDNNNDIEYDSVFSTTPTMIVTPPVAPGKPPRKRGGGAAVAPDDDDDVGGKRRIASMYETGDSDPDLVKRPRTLAEGQPIEDKDDQLPPVLERKVTPLYDAHGWDHLSFDGDMSRFTIPEIRRIRQYFMLRRGGYYKADCIRLSGTLPDDCNIIPYEQLIAEYRKWYLVSEEEYLVHREEIDNDDIVTEAEEWYIQWTGMLHNPPRDIDGAHATTNIISGISYAIEMAEMDEKTTSDFEEAIERIMVWYFGDYTDLRIKYGSTKWFIGDGDNTTPIDLSKKYWLPNPPLRRMKVGEWLELNDIKERWGPDPPYNATILPDPRTNLSKLDDDKKLISTDDIDADDSLHEWDRKTDVYGPFFDARAYLPSTIGVTATTIAYEPRVPWTGDGSPPPVRRLAAAGDDDDDDSKSERIGTRIKHIHTSNGTWNRADSGGMSAMVAAMARLKVTPKPPNESSTGRQQRGGYSMQY